MGVRFQVTGPLVHIQTQNAGEKILIDPLTVVVGVPASTFVAERDIEIAVGPEMQIAPIVICLLVVLIDQNDFRARLRLIRILSLRLKAGKALV